MSGEVPIPDPSRGIKFLVGGVLGGTVLVVILSAAVQDWSYLTRWVTGVAVIGLVIGYELGRGWLIMRAIRLAELQCYNVPTKQGREA